MQRTYTYLDVEFTVTVSAMPGRRWAWRYDLPWTVSGTGIARGIEPAFDAGERGGRVAIAEELDG